MVAESLGHEYDFAVHFTPFGTQIIYEDHTIDQREFWFTCLHDANTWFEDFTEMYGFPSWAVTTPLGAYDEESATSSRFTWYSGDMSVAKVNTYRASWAADNHETID